MIKATIQRDGYLKLEAETEQDSICLLWWIQQQAQHKFNPDYNPEFEPKMIIDTKTDQERAAVYA